MNQLPCHSEDKPARAKMASEGQQFPVDWMEEEEALVQVIIQ